MKNLTRESIAAPFYSVDLDFRLRAA